MFLITLPVRRILDIQVFFMIHIDFNIAIDSSQAWFALFDINLVTKIDVLWFGSVFK